MTNCTRAKLFDKTDHVGASFETNVLATALELVGNWAKSGKIVTEQWQRGDLIVALGDANPLVGTTKSKSMKTAWGNSLKRGLTDIQVWLQSLKFPKQKEQEEWTRHMVKLTDVAAAHKLDDLYTQLEAAVRRLIPQWSADHGLIEGVCGDERPWAKRFDIKDGKFLDTQKCRLPIVDKDGVTLSEKSDPLLLIAATALLTAMRKAVRHDVTGDTLHKLVEYEVTEGVYMAANHHPLPNPEACRGAFIMDSTSTTANACVLHTLVTLSKRVDLDWKRVNDEVTDRLCRYVQRLCGLCGPLTLDII